MNAITNAITNKKVQAKAITLASAIILSLILPQIFHYAGIISNQGGAIGATFLPMHLPVIMAGLLGGPIVGVLAGAISPVASFGISGMPVATLLPFMTVELASYGAIAGLVKDKRIPVIVKLLIVQIGGRAVRALAILLAIYAFNSSTPISSIWSIITAGFLGIALQWAIVPLLAYRLKPLGKFYE